MADVIYKKTVSDSNVRTVLKRIADLANENIKVHSGDRSINQNISGSGLGSLHIARRAADFHFQGMSDTEGFDFISRNMNRLFDQTEAYEMIQHRPGTATQGPHLHLGRYGDDRKGYVDFKKDGLELGKRYRIDRVYFTFPDGAPIKLEDANPVYNAGAGNSPTNTIESVGKNGRNHENDVRKVQFLLNLAQLKMIEANISFQRFAPIVENGNSGEDTIRAITIFQRDVLNMRIPDGRVDPGGKTLQMLYLAAYNPSDETLQKLNRGKTLREADSSEFNGILAWGNYANPNITPAFIEKTMRICRELNIKNPSWLMTVMAFETKYTFSPSKKNEAGSSGTGLIQFMKETIDGRVHKGKFYQGIGPKLGITHSQLAGMTAERQLDVVKVYFQQFGSKPEQAQDVDDLYFLVLRPASFGKPDDTPVFVKGTEAYKKNSGLDVNKDERVDVGETAGKIRAAYQEGLSKYGLRIKQ